MSGNSINFNDKKNKKVTSTITKTKKIFNINNIDVNKILVFKNTLLAIMIMMLLNHYI